MSWFVEKLYRYEIEPGMSQEEKNNPFNKLIEDEFEEVIVSLDEDKKNGKSTDPSNVSSEQRP